MTEYFQSREVFFCCRGNALVFLDLARDSYLMVDGETATALRLLFSTGQPSLAANASQKLDALVKDNLLTLDKLSGKRICPTFVQPASIALLEDEHGSVRLNLKHFCNFVIACGRAAISLRRDELKNTIHRIAVRKTRNAARHWSIREARELTRIFSRLRAFFPRNYLCIFDCLALLEFLASYDVFPTWVFGIRLEPWAAHCWVQHDEWCFNEDPEEATSYTPIMAI